MLTAKRTPTEKNGALKKYKTVLRFHWAALEAQGQQHNDNEAYEQARMLHIFNNSDTSAYFL